MFSEENTIQIIQVKDKLKYWGLTKGQVKHLCEVNPSDESTFINTDTECSICKVEYSNSDKAIETLIPCGHKFHSECIHKWLDPSPNENRKCPRCNKHITFKGDGNNRFIRFIENFMIITTNNDEPAPNGPLLMPSNEDITPVTAFNTPDDDEQPPEGGYRKKKNTRKLKKRRSNSL